MFLNGYLKMIMEMIINNIKLIIRYLYFLQYILDDNWQKLHIGGTKWHKR